MNQILLFVVYPSVLFYSLKVTGHFNNKNIKARKSVLECVEKRVSHSLLDQRLYCMVKLEKLVHH